ncbi:MAG: FadR/GntR family transcriptional regulator [Parasphingorhabdus sp.]
MKMSEKIALEVVRKIAEDNLMPGDPLPKEAEIIEMFDASRASVREALRLLEVQGLIQIRQGSHNGTTVGKVDVVNLSRTMTLYFHLAGVTYDEVFEAWRLTEPLLAQNAARNRDRALVKKKMEPFLDANNSELDNMIEFHRTIFSLAGNRALSFMVRAIGTMCMAIVRELGAKNLAAFRQDQTEIAQAILEGDTASAQDITMRSLQQVETLYRSEFPDKVGGKIRLPDSTNIAA